MVKGNRGGKDLGSPLGYSPPTNHILEEKGLHNRILNLKKRSEGRHGTGDTMKGGRRLGGKTKVGGGKKFTGETVSAMIRKVS